VAAKAGTVKEISSENRSLRTAKSPFNKLNDR
jgi:hypothetical protein